MPSRIREVLPLARRAGLVLSQPALPKHRLPPRSSAAAAASATGGASQQRSRPVAHPVWAPPTAGETARFLSEAMVAAVAADAQAEAQGGVQGSMQETLATASPAASPTAAIERSTTSADSVFEKAIRRLEREFGKEGLVFPKEITFLNGAPGSGKTHNSRFMLEARGLAGRPIVVSDLLKSRPEFCKSMNAGRLVEDVDVVEVLLRELLSPVHAAGVLVDGFPRSLTQAESCWKLQALMKSLRAEKVAELVSNGFAPTASAVRYPVPRFFVCILHVSEEQSIARQIQRGKDALRHNAHVREVGAGDLVEERATDLNPVLLRQRYRTFERHRDTLERLMTYFPFKIIDASRDVEEVRAQILTEFQYQSKQELSRAAFDAIQPVPLASRVGSNARPDLCQRLGEYAAFFPERFASAVSLVNDRIVPQLRAAAFAGQAIVRFPPEASEHVELSRTDSCCLREMVLDTLAERGYSPHYDAEETLVPVRVDMRSGNIVSVRRVVHVFRIGFPEAKLSHDNIRALNENRESEEPQPGFP